jgi:hypothetical protein
MGRRWAQENAERQRPSAVRQQLLDMPWQIILEQASEGEHTWHQRYDERKAAIQREARRRLGLPEEDA